MRVKKREMKEFAEAVFDRAERIYAIRLERILNADAALMSEVPARGEMGEEPNEWHRACSEVIEVL